MRAPGGAEQPLKEIGLSPLVKEGRGQGQAGEDPRRGT